MKQKNSYNYQDLIDCGKGILFGEGNAKLPLPPMLMFDRITKIESNTGTFKKGYFDECELFQKKGSTKWTYRLYFNENNILVFVNICSYINLCMQNKYEYRYLFA